MGACGIQWEVVYLWVRQSNYVGSSGNIIPSIGQCFSTLKTLFRDANFYTFPSKHFLIKKFLCNFQVTVEWLFYWLQHDLFRANLCRANALQAVLCSDTHKQTCKIYTHIFDFWSDIHFSSYRNMSSLSFSRLF